MWSLIHIVRLTFISRAFEWLYKGFSLITIFIVAYIKDLIPFGYSQTVYLMLYRNYFL